MFPLYNFDNVGISFRYYGGSDQKSSMKLNGRDYMVKFAAPIQEKNDLAASFSNSVISEFIACHIISSMGYLVQETLLGILNNQLVVACEDFTQNNERLVEFNKIENRIIDPLHRKRTPALCNLEQVFSGSVFPTDFRQSASDRYWDIFIIDALIGNFDRHSGNWGYLVNETTGKFKNAPIYDCGSSLYPQLSDDSLHVVLQSEAEIQKRVDIFPKAALTLAVGGEKLGYKDFITSGYKPCVDALLRVTPRISMQKITGIIDNTPAISNIRKEFYKTILTERYHRIILEPYLQLERKPTLQDRIEKAEKETPRHQTKHPIYIEH